jgi:SPP1 family predicted phage head-tail adaptor
MATGNLNKRMTLQKETLVPDGSGGKKGSWIDIAPLWAELIPIATDTVVVVSNYNRRLTHKIVLRYREDISTGMRLVFGSRSFVVRAIVDRDEKNEWLDLWAEEGGLL